MIQEYEPQGILLVPQVIPDPSPPAAAPGTANSVPQPHTRKSLVRPFATKRLETTMIPADIELRRDESVYMSLGDLLRKASVSLDQNGWYMKFFSRFAYPLTNFVLVLLGLPVIVHFGNRNIFFGAILAVLISTSYFVLNSVFQDMGIQGTIPVRLGAVLAPVLFTALGATLYRRCEAEAAQARASASVFSLSRPFWKSGPISRSMKRLKDPRHGIPARVRRRLSTRLACRSRPARSATRRRSGTSHPRTRGRT
jgi:hypothetical protein